MNDKLTILIAIPFLITCLVLTNQKAYSHSGRTDSYGCHNCYTSYCNGEYHCHNGGGSSNSEVYRNWQLLSAPKNPKSGDISFEISSENWCNYDVHINWEESSNSDRYSVGVSKSAGSDPGPLPDTKSRRFTFSNISPGSWYINLKAGNDKQWSNEIVYWPIDLPKPKPRLSAYLQDNRVKYNFACLKRVEGPQEFIDSVEITNSPTGSFLLTASEPRTIVLSGFDKNNKKYSRTLSYSPPKKASINNQKELTKNKSETRNNLVIAALSVVGFSFLFHRLRS